MLENSRQSNGENSFLGLFPQAEVNPSPSPAQTTIAQLCLDQDGPARTGTDTTGVSLSQAFNSQAQIGLVKGKESDVIYHDLWKAVDTVPHDNLVSKLERHGLEGWTTQWIKNWLDGHSQKVEVNGFMSNQRPVTSGIPQASVLEQALFNIFVSDMVSGIEFTLSKFADDTKMCCLVRLTCWREGMPSKGVLTGLRSEACVNLMKLNKAKCKVLHADVWPLDDFQSLQGSDLWFRFPLIMEGSQEEYEQLFISQRAGARDHLYYLGTCLHIVNLESVQSPWINNVSLLPMICWNKLSNIRAQYTKALWLNRDPREVSGKILWTLYKWVLNEGLEEGNGHIHIMLVPPLDDVGLSVCPVSAPGSQSLQAWTPSHANPCGYGTTTGPKVNRVLYQNKCGQQVEGGDSAPLLCPGKTSPGVLHPAPESPEQERYEAGPEESYGDD
ncbi:hypothetical protein BTVI_65118 [Pitangus sulphuratus]|nr:hypothetical protein BTVI_65118 [Pitangus sulphuratus]